MNDQQIYTIQDVRFILNRALRKSIPKATLKRWKRVVEVNPEYIDGEWLYTRSDIDALITLGKWLRVKNATVKGFKQHYQI